LGVIVVLPFTGRFARLMIRIIPDHAEPLTRRLDRSLLASPPVAVDAVRDTLNELADQVFEQFPLSRHTKDDEENRREVLAKCREALSEAREYADEIHIPSDDETIHQRHVSVFHTIDHLRRLIKRFRNRKRIRAVRGDSELLTIAAEFEAPLRAVREQIHNREQLNERPFKEIWDRLATLVEPYRKTTVEQAAAGRLDAATAIARLDGIRWLRRTAYHIWRILVHLQRMDT
jgi:phosphate:Na+ symporter